MIDISFLATEFKRRINSEYLLLPVLLLDLVD